MTDRDELREALERAVSNAIRTVGLEVFKRTSLFMSSRKESTA